MSTGVAPERRRMTPGPSPWAGERDPAHGLRRRTPGARPVLPVPPGTVVYAIPSDIERIHRKAQPFRAEGDEPLALVRSILTTATGDPTAELRDPRLFMHYARRYGWFIVMVRPDGTVEELSEQARRERTSPFWHDLAALAHVQTAEQVKQAQREQSEQDRAERRARQEENLRRHRLAERQKNAAAWAVFVARIYLDRIAAESDSDAA